MKYSDSFFVVSQSFSIFNGISGDTNEFKSKRRYNADNYSTDAVYFFISGVRDDMAESLTPIYNESIAPISMNSNDLTERIWMGSHRRCYDTDPSMVRGDILVFN